MSSKFGVLTSLIGSYLSSKNEWYYNYKLSMYLFISSIFCMVLYGIVGDFSLFPVLYKICIIIMFGHIILSVLAVLNDYIFNLEVKSWCQSLWLLISFRVLLEVLIW